MSVKVQDATVFIADDDTLSTSSADYHTLVISGDTMRIASQRAPAYNDTGYEGEVCIGTVSGTTYLYYHNGTQWLRIAFSTY